MASLDLEDKEHLPYFDKHSKNILDNLSNENRIYISIDEYVLNKIESLLYF